MTELTGVPIPVINWQSGNLPEAPRKFKRKCEYIFNGPLATKDEAVKVQSIYNAKGRRGRSGHTQQLGANRGHQQKAGQDLKIMRNQNPAS